MKFIFSQTKHPVYKPTGVTMSAKRLCYIWVGGDAIAICTGL